MITAVLASFIFVTATFGLQFKLHRVRLRRVGSIELRPNCLLTRYPILFVSGPRSLFRVFEPWNEIPLFLREHGYEVFVFEPNYNRCFVRRRTVASQIRESLPNLSTVPKNKFHLIADSSCEYELHELAEKLSPQIASLTLVTADTDHHLKTSIRPRSLKPLAIAIEEFQILASSLKIQPADSNSNSAKWSRLALRFLTFHNWISQFKSPTRAHTHPLTVGQIITTDWQIELRFLARAMELAEKDAQFLTN